MVDVVVVAFGGSADGRDGHPIESNAKGDRTHRAQSEIVEARRLAALAERNVKGHKRRGSHDIVMASAQGHSLQSGTRERGEVLALLLRKGDAGLTVPRLRHAGPLLRGK